MTGFTNKLIDLHHHILPPAYVKSERDRLLRSAPAYAWTLDWTPEFSLEQMDRAGIATAVTSISTFGLNARDPAGKASLARECNEYAAWLRDEYPGRFGMFASLPLPHVREALDEIAYAFDHLNADGVCLMTNYGGLWPGDASFAPIFDALNERGALTFFHPTVSDRCADLIAEIPNAFLEYPFDTTRAIGSLLYSGTISRADRIRFLFSHGGGTLPMVAHRLAMIAQIRPELAARVPNGVLPTLSTLYFDTCSVTNDAAFSALSRIAAMNHIVYGTDSPYGQPPSMRDFEDLRLSDGDLLAIGRGNAASLLHRVGP